MILYFHFRVKLLNGVVLGHWLNKPEANRCWLWKMYVSFDKLLDWYQKKKEQFLDFCQQAAISVKEAFEAYYLLAKKLIELVKTYFKLKKMRELVQLAENLH